MYYLHKLELDEFGNEFARIVGKTSKTYERAVIRGKRLQNALVVEFPNNPLCIIRNGIEVLRA